MADDRVQKLLRYVPRALKRALVEEAEIQGTNLNDVAVTIIAEAFGMKYTPSGKRTPGWSDSEDVNLLMPDRIRRRVNVIAAQRGQYATDLMLEALCDYFDMTLAA